MKCTAIGVLALTGLAASASAQNLPVLIEVDVSDLSAVTFSTTGAAPVVSTTEPGFAGVTLVEIATDNTSGNRSVPGGTLGPGASGGAYDNLTNSFSTLDVRDLNFWGSPGTQVFDTSMPAFAGSITVDLSDADFLAPGSTGIIIAGDSPRLDVDPNAILGSWIIVPAPGAMAMAPVALLAVRRRRK